MMRACFMDQESLSREVGSFIRSKGYVLAADTGVPMGRFSLIMKEQCFGILLHEEPRRYFFGLIKITPRRLWIGKVHFHSSEPTWLFEVYGSGYVDMLRELADEMAQEFEVDVTVSLVREEADYARLPFPLLPHDLGGDPSV